PRGASRGAMSPRFPRRPLPLVVALATALALSAKAVRAVRAGDSPPSTEQGYVMLSAWPAPLLNDAYVKKLKRAGAQCVLVIDVVAGGPADKAGVKEGDALLKFDGQDVRVPEDDPEGESFGRELSRITDKVKAGAKVTLVVERDGEKQTLEAVAVGDDERARIQAVADEQGGVPEVPSLKAA